MCVYIYVCVYIYIYNGFLKNPTRTFVSFIFYLALIDCFYDSNSGVTCWGSGCNSFLLQLKARTLSGGPIEKFASCQCSLLQTTLSLGWQGLWSELCDTNVQLR